MLRILPVIAILALLAVLSGCAGMEYAPKRGVAYYPKELVAADRAVESARQAGKDRECPEAFLAAEKMKNNAYDVYLSCHTKEGIALAVEATNAANALCPRRGAAPSPLAPRASLSADPTAIQAGQCTTLTWSSANATSASIDAGVGSVDLNGSRQVCPGSTTQYTFAARGDGGLQTAAATVDVTALPPAPAAAAPAVVDRLVLHVNFDFDKSKVRDEDIAELQKAVEFVKKYPGYQVSIEGHTDSIGTDTYNQALSERRAAAVKAFLLQQGVVDSQRIKSAGFGESKPVADNRSKQGRFENRRVEIPILSE
jgi:outer membrane protein OmpA-like peptidoglycan-associated protein